MVVDRMLSDETNGILHGLHFVDNPAGADIVIDDLLDSGETVRKVRDEVGIKNKMPEFFFLFNKQEDTHLKDKWFVFPWEAIWSPNDVDEGEGPTDAVIRILQHIGEDPRREGLRDTPKRVVKAWGDLCSGYGQNPEDFLTVFDGEGYDEMVLLKNCEFSSMCEHHMLPFIGIAHIAYIPNGKVIGLSKLARILDMYARRLQIQEQMTMQITNALQAHLEPRGVACIIEAKHQCMSCRGIRKQNSSMVTSSMVGVFRDDKSQARSELLQLIKD